MPSSIAISDTLLNKHQEDEWGVEWINEQTSSEIKLKTVLYISNKMQGGDANRYEFNILFPGITNQKQKDNITPIPQSHWEA